MRPQFERLLSQKGELRRLLLGWYRRNARDLPWRGSRDPYVIWLSEVVLQQTRIEQGTPYIERFLKALPTVHDLADADEDRVLKLWEGLGYYARGRNLHKAAREIVKERDGRFPQTAGDWRTLPGVGPYTAGAIASIAFHEPVPVLDGNVKRLLSRLTDLDECIDETGTTRALWDLAAELVRGRVPGTFNQSMMELGARTCVPKRPRCARCPLRRLCASYDAGTQLERPLRRPRKELPHHRIVVGAIRKNGRYLLGKRPATGMLGGLWEFPGGKIEAGEDHARALKRELREELGISIRLGDHIATVQHAYSHFRITLDVYRCVHTGGSPRQRAHTALKWVQPSRFGEFAFPKANHKFLHLL